MESDLYIMGILKKDEKYTIRKEIYDKCKKINVTPPNEILEYFSSGIEMISLSAFSKRSYENGELSISINVEDIPSNVHTIRVSKF